MPERDSSTDLGRLAPTIASDPGTLDYYRGWSRWMAKELPRLNFNDPKIVQWFVNLKNETIAFRKELGHPTPDPDGPPPDPQHSNLMQMLQQAGEGIDSARWTAEHEDPYQGTPVKPPMSGQAPPVTPLGQQDPRSDLSSSYHSVPHSSMTPSNPMMPPILPPSAVIGPGPQPPEYNPYDPGHLGLQRADKDLGIQVLRGPSTGTEDPGIQMTPEELDSIHEWLHSDPKVEEL